MRIMICQTIWRYYPQMLFGNTGWGDAGAAAIGAFVGSWLG